MFLHFKVNNIKSKIDIQVISLNGELILHKILDACTNLLDVSHLTQGVYKLKVNNFQSSYTTKFEKR